MNPSGGVAGQDPSVAALRGEVAALRAELEDPPRVAALAQADAVGLLLAEVFPGDERPLVELVQELLDDAIAGRAR